ncbi:Cation/H(+) antiporter 15 [Glycine soja]
MEIVNEWMWISAAWIHVESFAIEILLLFLNTLLPSIYAVAMNMYKEPGFPMVSHILADLKLLYPGLGKVALATAMISDFYNWVMFALLVPFAINGGSIIYSVLSTLAFVLFCFIVVRPCLLAKPHKNEWDNYGLFFVIMGAYTSALVTDLLGDTPCGWGSDAHREVRGFWLAPLFLGSIGIRFRIVYVVNTQGLGLVLLVLLLSFIPKILSTVIASQFYGMSVLDGVSIGLLMNTKGILPILMLNNAWDKQILSVESFSILTVAVVMMTMTVPLIINAIYKLRKLYKQSKLKTIQNLKAEIELRILACVHNPRQATGMINILDACHTTKLSPLRVFALQLVELSGNTTSLFNQQRSGGAQALTKAQEDLESITNIFQTYTGANENTSVETFAAASTYSNIHEDIYNVSQEKQASLMRDAPCSVGIIVDRGLGSLFKVNLRVLVLFIGGPDDREALAVAWRMSKHQGVQLSVMRILMYGEAAEVDVLSHVESRGLLSVDKEQVGTRNSLILSELIQWAHCPELGVIGDMVASNNFGSSSSVLVGQKYGYGGVVFDNSNAATQQQPREVMPADDDNDDSGALAVKIE